MKGGARKNLEFLIDIRHEVEHRMTDRIDDAIGAKLQACALNFNDLLKKEFGAGLGLEKRLPLALQFTTFDRDQRALLKAAAALPPNVEAANPEETFNSTEDARRMPSSESEYRNLILNQRIDAKSPFIARPIWMENAENPESIDGADVYGGLDLSTVSDLTALALVYRKDPAAKWSVQPHFWLPDQGLIQKAKADKVPYDKWKKDGDLVAVPGRVIDYDYVATQIWALGQRCSLRKIAFDRWGFVHFEPALIRGGFTEKVIEDVFVPFGQGFKDMSPALRTLESMLLRNELRHGEHPVLTMCMANAVVVKDPAGNRELTKETGSAKIDGAIALAMACSIIDVADESDAPSYLASSPMLFL